MKKQSLVIPVAALALATMLSPNHVTAQRPASGYRPDEAPPPGSRYAQRAAAGAESPNKKPSYTRKFDLSGLPHYTPEEQVTGTLRIWGNNYIGDSNLADYWEQGFQKFQPGVKFDYNLPSAAIAIPSLYFDLADIAMDHDPLFYDYLGHVRIKGTEPIGFSAVTGSYNTGGWQTGLVVAVPKANPLSKLTLKQLDGIFGAERFGAWIGTQWHPEFTRGPEQNIRKWGELGLTGQWANQQINPYGPSLVYETAWGFANRVLQHSDKWNEHIRAYGNWKQADGTNYGWMTHMADEMKQDPYSIGIFIYNTDFSPELKVLALAGKEGGPYVEYNMDTQRERTYPLWTEQSLYVSPKPGQKLAPKIREFLRYVLSQEGQNEVQRDGKYLPLTAEVVRENLKKLE
ncbi:MAG: hypothetical protein PHQ04_12170 [Opitutaceae bacterium]|nr:hypothetical protein [Opitutaceae bacterium]